MKKLCILSALLLGAAAAQAQTKVLIIAGPDSHGWGAHDHHAVSEILAKCLNESGLGIEASVHYDTWPEDAALLDGLDALVYYGDGGPDANVLAGHAADLAKLKEQGAGLAIFHWALDMRDEALRALALEWLGGYYEINWSVNPMWTLEEPVFGEHPVTNGVGAFALEDEWYYHMRFRDGMEGVTPLLSKLPSEDTLKREDGEHSNNPHVRKAVLEDKEVQHFVWAAENGDDSRGFAFSGGHWRRNWADDNFRTLMLNGIAWIAGAEVPEGGVPSETPIIVKNEKMLQAVALGDVEDVLRHIKLGADVNEKNSSGWTPLHYAAVRGQLEVGKVLLENGAEPGPLSSRNQAPIHFTAERGFPDFAALLIEHGADINVGDQAGWTPLHTAAAKNKAEVIALLIEAGAEVNKKSELGGTALHEAAVAASPEVIKLLLDGGVDPAIKATEGNTALDNAKEYENAEAVKLLGGE